MSKNTEQELAKLLEQCESVLHVYADKTGASVFAEALNDPISSRTGAAKANDLEDLERQREALAQEQEQQRQAGLENKRQAMFRGGKKKPVGQPATAATHETSSEPIISNERIVLGKVHFGSRQRQ